MATDFTSGYAGIYTGSTVSQLIDRMKYKLGQSGFTRYSLQYMLDCLDDKQRDFAYRTRVLKGWSLIPMRAGIMSYALPKMCLPDGLERARFFTAENVYDDLELRDREYMDSHYPGWMTVDDGTPMIVVAGDWFGNVLKIDLYPPPLTSGTTYTSGTNLGVTIGGTALPTTWNNITGIATGGSTTTLEDTAVDFTTMGLVEGMAVVKVDTAGGQEGTGYIETIETTTLTFAEVLTNSQSFTEGDSYQIMAGEVGAITSVENEEAYVFTADVGAIGMITVPANNLMVEFRRYPVAISAIETMEYQKPEIPWSWHKALADGAAGEILEADTQRRSQLDLAFSQKLQSVYERALLECVIRPSVPIRKTAHIVPRLSR